MNAKTTLFQHVPPHGRQPAGPAWYTLLGHLTEALPDRLGWLRACPRLYGDVVNLTLIRPTYLLNDPEDIRYVLEGNHLNYTKTRRLTGACGKRLAGHGLLTSSGPAAIALRRVLAPVVLPSNITEFDQAVIEYTDAMVAGWSTGETIDLASELLRLAQRILGRLLFGLDFTGDGKDLAGAISIRRLFIQRHFKSLGPILDFVPSRLHHQYRQAMKVFDRRVAELIRARREHPAHYQDILASLIVLTHSDGNPITDREVRDEALTLATTGYVTLGETLAWMWYLLATNPLILEEVRAEIQRALRDRPPTLEDIPRFSYCEQVLSESLRMYPPTWIFARVALQDDVLPCGVAIPSGCKLYLSPYVTHHDPRYFPDPDHFEPERFSDHAKRTRPRYAYFPLSGGPRICLGQQFARTEALLVLARLVQLAVIDLTPDQTIRPRPGQILSQTQPLLVRWSRRKPRVPVTAEGSV